MATQNEKKQQKKYASSSLSILDIVLIVIGSIAAFCFLVILAFVVYFWDVTSSGKVNVNLGEYGTFSLNPEDVRSYIWM